MTWQWLSARVNSLQLILAGPILTKVPKNAGPWVSTLVRIIFEQSDAKSVRAQHAQVGQALETKLPAAAHLGRCPRRHPGLHRVPREVSRQVWSNYPPSSE